MRQRNIISVVALFIVIINSFGQLVLPVRIDTQSTVNDIQDAINQVSAAGGGTVQLSAGTYIITSSIQMKSNVCLQGVGTATRIELPTDASYAMIVDDGTEPCVNMTIRNLLLDGNIPESKVSHDPDYTSDPQNPCLGIFFDAYNKETYHTNVVIENIEVHNTVDACHLKGVKGGYINNVYFHHNGIFYWPGHNAYLRRCINFSVKNSRFEDSYNGSGVNCSWSENLLFSNCMVVRSNGRGIRNAASDGFVVHDCIIVNCGTEGIIANSEQGITTSNCDFRRNCVSGCETGIRGGASGVAFDNNVFSNSTDYSLGSAISQSGNTSDPNLSCSDKIGEWNPISFSAYVVNENPKQVILEVSQEIAENGSIEGFTVYIDGVEEKIDSITMVSQTQLAFNLSEDIKAENVLSISYSESGNLLTHSGTTLNAFEDLQVDNAVGEPFGIESISIDSSGTFVTLELNRQIGTIHKQVENFVFTINNAIIPAAKTLVYNSTVLVFSTTKIYMNDEVYLSYQPDAFTHIIATNNTKLEAFNDLMPENLSKLTVPLIPGKIEAEEYASQYGILLENCSEGGQNLVYIDTDDWVEYKVQISSDTTYKATFRVASKYIDCSIIVIVDGSTKGIVEVPLTGALYTYESVSTDLKLSSGTHTIKLLFSGKFNLNWMLFEETEPGNEGVFFDRIEAENYNANSGGSIEDCSDSGGGEHVGSIVNDNWLMFRELDLSDVGGIDMRLATKKSGCSIEVRLDSLRGTLIGTLSIPNTGAWQTWETVSAKLGNTIGIHDIYLVFKSSDSWVCNINWFIFTPKENLGSFIENVHDGQELKVYPNPVRDFLTIEGKENSKIEIWNIMGQKVYEDYTYDLICTISTAGMKPGVYLLRILNDGTILKSKFLKE